ncbi:MAG: right-handed parallel beta-helix repeat-containing protein [Bacteroidia bacterium]|nr:right-handed parallel beta-helix repeat-containing protein [Bacteroidia bacterium]
MVSAQGATTPFTTYEAENGTLSGGASILAATTLPSAPTVQFESSGRRCVELNATDESVSWTTTDITNTIVVRVSMPDAVGGGGIVDSLNLYVDGVFRQSLVFTSKYAWIYGVNDMVDNNPATGTPHRFFESERAFITGAAVALGSTMMLKKDAANTAPYYRIDLILLENVGPALTQPANSLSVLTYGATGNDATDDSQAFKNCIAACQSQKKGMWIPAGEFRTQGIIYAKGIKIYGAGMWYTTNLRIIGGRHKWDLTNCTIQDLTIFNPEVGRDLTQGHDYGMTIQGDLGWTVQRVWVQHGGASFWCSGTDGTIKDCRSFESWADGINLNNGPSPKADFAGIRLTAQNNFIIGSGDDGIAINAQNDGSTAANMVDAKVLNNTSIATLWGNGMRIAGGRNTVLQNNLITDPTDCNGIRIGEFGTNGNPCESALVSDNLILRGCGIRATYGHGGIAVTDNCNATVNSNTITDCPGIGIDVQSCTATFTGNVINHPALQGFLVKTGSIGSGTFTSNTVLSLNSGQVAFRNDAPSTYTVGASGNSWQPNGFQSAVSASENSLNVYPNLVRNTLTIIGIEVPTEVLIINVSGQVVSKAKSWGTMDVSSLVPGIYFLRSGNQKPVRFIKN